MRLFGRGKPRRFAGDDTAARAFAALELSIELSKEAERALLMGAPADCQEIRNARVAMSQAVGAVDEWRMEEAYARVRGD